MPLDLPVFHARDYYLFDHIPRTGGTYFAKILDDMLGKTSENFDCEPGFPDLHADEVRRLNQYQVVVGHMRLETVKAFRQLRPRRLISLVRDPVSQIESTYNFWRHNITQDLPNCNLAKRLSFSDFIRCPDVRMAVDNPLTRHFFGLWDIESLQSSETSRIMAIQMAESYAFIGVTERMDETIQALQKLFHTKNPPRSTKDINRNASKGSSEVLKEDVAFLRERCALDYAIYEHVNATLDRLLYGSGSGAALVQNHPSERANLR